jgi:hypothetical protein
MGRIIVTTGTKTKEADAITNPILSGLAMIEAGKQLLYHEMVDRTELRINVAMVSTLPLPSEIVRIDSKSLGVDSLAVITSFSFSVNNNDIELGFSCEMPIIEV